MNSLNKKITRLDPIIDERKNKLDIEQYKLQQVRQRKVETVKAMKKRQNEYMEGVERLNHERSSANRLMLEALETGLDTIKQDWMNLYHEVLKVEKEEHEQLQVMSQAHKDLEAIHHLQSKYKAELDQTIKQAERKLLDELALRKFTHAS